MNDDLQSFIEPELEARIVALVLREASAFETEALEVMMAERPELVAFKARMELVHGVVGEAHCEVNSEEWQLSGERREAVVSRFRERARVEIVEKRRAKVARKAQWNWFYACAACLMLTLLLGGGIYSMGTVKERAELKVYAAEEMTSAQREKALARLDAEIEAQSDLVQDHRKDLTVLVQQYGIPYFEGGESNPIGATEQDMFRSARSRLAELETAKEEVEGQLEELAELDSENLVAYSAGLELPENQVEQHFNLHREAIEKKRTMLGQGLSAKHPDVIAVEEDAAVAMEQARKEAVDLKAVLKTKSELLSRQVDRVSGMVNERQDDTVDLSLRQHHYSQAKETYEQSREMLREMKIKQAETRRILDPEFKWGFNSEEATFSAATALANIDSELPRVNGGFPVTRATPVAEAEPRVVLGGAAAGGAEAEKSKVVRTEVPRKPAAPSGSLSRAIAVNSAGVTPAPVAEVEAVDPFMDFGDGDSFGDGWAGKGNDESLAQKEEIKRQARMLEADDALMDGRRAYAKGDYEGAVQEYREALSVLPYGTATAERRKVLNDHLADGSVALTQKYRRVGKYEEARDLLEEVERNDPGSAIAEKGLEYLDDPIRTNPSLTYEHTKNVDKVRRNLYKGEGFYDLGLYDKAEEEFKEVLRIDPYNRAARRWMERASAIKSDYYRAAYDNTRAEMQMEVDREWELAVPPVNGRDSAAQNGKKLVFGNEAEVLPVEGVITAGNRAAFGRETEGERGVIDSIPLYYKSQNEKQSSAEQELTLSKLNQTILPELKLEDVTVEDALALIQEKTVELDSSALDDVGRGVEFGVSQPKLTYEDAEGFGAEIDYWGVKIKKLDLKNVPARVALQYVADAAKLRYKVEDDGKVKLLPLGNGEDADVVQRRWQVPPNFGRFIALSGGAGGGADDDPFASGSGSGGIKPREDITSLLRKNGVNFPEGTSASYLADSDTLIIRNTPTNLELVDGIVKAGAAVVSGEGAWSKTSKLEQIIFPEVKFSNARVSEVLGFLREKSVELDNTTLDESHKGVNIVEHLMDETSIDSLNLKNATFRQVLDEIELQAGVTVEVDDFAVTLSEKPGEDWVASKTGGQGSEKTARALKTKSVPVVQLRDASIYETTKLLSAKFKELFPSEDAVEFAFEHEGVGKLVVDELRLKNVPFEAILKYVADSTTSRYRIEGNKVVFFSKNLPAPKVKDGKFETLTAEKADSTFSLNVSDVSFKLAKATLAKGNWPSAGKVRPEEFVNALDYDDRKPSQIEKVACAIEQGAHPFMQQRNLMRIAMSTASLGRNGSTPLRLTILLDQSGSMERVDRAESVQRAFALLAAQLNANDEVTLVGFARTPRLLAERVKGNEAGKLAEIIAKPLTEGGTNLEAALTTGLQLAQQQFLAGAQNRVILLTDGAANLGDALPENLALLVESMRKKDIAFDACGVGADGLNDEVLGSLAKQGDGRYYFLDRPEDADAGFAKQIAGALRPAAKNVKVQILFNPERVSKFKLYGFEKHKLKKEDFRNDAVDAAEMAAEESGVALYHFEALPEGRGDVGTVSVRFFDPSTKQMVERTWAIPYEPEAALFSESEPSLRLASVAGLFAEKLKGSEVGGRVDLKRLRQETELLKLNYELQPRFHELQNMLQQAGQ